MNKANGKNGKAHGNLRRGLPRGGGADTIRPMRPATKHWLFLIFLVASLAILATIALWQMDKARREGPPRPAAPLPAEPHGTTQPPTDVGGQ
jgi:hypothetical protein